MDVWQVAHAGDEAVEADSKPQTSEHQPHGFLAAFRFRAFFSGTPMGAFSVLMPVHKPNSPARRPCML
jgi:hypothetical protein